VRQGVVRSRYPVLRPRMQRSASLVCAAVFALVSAASREAGALTIVPTFNANLSASSIATIKTAIKFYETTFSDPITVPIEFHNMSSGLGASSFVVYNVSYAGYTTALNADRSTPDDATANVAIGTVDPVFGGTRISVHSANGRAIGLATNAVSLGSTFCSGLVVDGCIGLHLSITNDPGAGVGPGGYSLISTVEHEIDEVLGLGSGLQGNGTIFNNRIAPEDLFRYASNGVRSFGLHATCPGPAAYFSIDGGATMLDQFNNCTNGGDYADWVTHTPQQVQDAFSNNSAKPTLTRTSPEIRALDVIGYNVAAPEPSSGILLATGLAAVALGRSRRRKTRRD
jgi:hypothetical protein